MLSGSDSCSDCRPRMSPDCPDPSDYIASKSGVERRNRAWRETHALPNVVMRHLKVNKVAAVLREYNSQTPS